MYVEFAQTTRGGKKREEEAKAQWLQWADQVKAKDPAVLYDYEGPEQQLRVWVHTGDTLKFRGSYMHEKGVVMEGQCKKKASEEDVDKMKGEILKGHMQSDFADSSAIAKALTLSGPDAFSKPDGLLDLALCQF